MRLLIISNRLPFTACYEKNDIKLIKSSGGLVSGLSAYLDSLKDSRFSDFSHIWIGWPGFTTNEKDKEKFEKQIYDEFNSIPVFISEEEMENFYQGFCNKTIWPLFHYFPSYASFKDEYWDSYKKVNMYFAEKILKIIKQDDIIWIHDYHLMLLPALLKEQYPDISIGYFHHIPFPSFEIFRLLPKQWRDEILKGILGADLIGFHIHEYNQYFLRNLLRILGLEHYLGKIIYNDRIIKSDTFPMGIDFNKFNNSVNLPDTQNEIKEHRKILKDKKVILSIDRLDYTKGILNRLQGFNLFLEKYPEFHKKIIFILVIVPSRIGVDDYQNMKSKIDEMVSSINGKFGSIDWAPIIYQYKHIPFSTLTALYNLADIALITPLRDGMNLVAKEYIATKVDKDGVLILSEMAGAAKELGEAIIINPNDISEISESLYIALKMSEDEKKEKNKIMQERLKTYNVNFWANDFINRLFLIKKEQSMIKARILSTDMKNTIINTFFNSRKKIIFLDYDGTLIGFKEQPSLAKPDNELLDMLDKLSKNSELVILSGRDKITLSKWFENLQLNLVAEHGVWIKEKNNDWHLLNPIKSDWKKEIYEIFKLYKNRLPGSFIEEKDYSLVFHYRKSDPEMASIRINELKEDLIYFTANIDAQVMDGKKALEVRCAGINKGTAGLYFLSKDNFDFILALGDDITDEDLFKNLPKNAWSIKIGIQPSAARFNLFNFYNVRNLLKEFIKNNK